MSNVTKPTVCYLCSNDLALEPTDVDHVPGQQFFAPAIRKAHGPQLLTIEVHKACNRAYKSDEDYFVQTLVPLARGSLAGNAIYRHALETYHKGHNVGLVRRVLGEFDHRPSGLILPGGKVAKRFQGARLSRVAFKIVRGLYFHHHGIALPADLRTSVRLIQPGHRPPEDFARFMQSDGNISHGAYQAVFAYRFQHYVDETNPTKSNMHYWALLFWDRIIFIVMFGDPAAVEFYAERAIEPQDQRRELEA